MSRASISTGGAVFGAGTASRSDDTHFQQEDSGQPMHILFVGDFSGRASRSVVDTQSLQNRKILEINRDNFDDVFSRLAVELHLPSCAAPIAFDELDDLHPDLLYKQLPLFERLRDLKRRLSMPATFDAAAKDMLAQGLGPVATPAPAGVTIPAGLFESVLSSQTSDAKAQTVDALINSIVAPFVQPKADPRAEELMRSVDLATAEALRTLMHTGAFQQLEANWRSLYWLCRNIETGRNLKLFILDVTAAELRSDFSQCLEITDAKLYQRIVSQYQVPGSVGFSVLVSDVTLTDKAEDIPIAAGLSAIATSSDAIALISGSEKIAGCLSLAETPDTDDWSYQVDTEFQELWQILREEPQAECLLVAAPRFLLRLPYGTKTKPIDSFAFEELGEAGEHKYYLWAQGAYLASYLVAKTFEQNFWDLASGVCQQVEDLPQSIYTDSDGDSQAKACAEIYMTDKTAAALLAAGLCPLRSVKNQAAVLVPRLVSMADTEVSVLDVISA
ncbi:type VI secretion system contractile sheath large subunit [Simiduia curdlanivorans]|uniref:Type VI secretion system contractile sheath domain-containing protein n=1 Tax=Simiduia curdlanivorans TaxID=1492769 RepID=A0ABV8V2Z9_9GAMM|nr:type VI secretion system contractile sheath large subunit [Simiduia curdlanivorans]MDN3640066.1 type VI secretion system contractile sheath large subunit [Simiduia curdlanivorans]